MFGPVPKVAWENSVVTDRKNRMTLGLNCLLLHSAGQNVLIDTGVGSKDMHADKEPLGLVPSRLLRGLKSVGLAPKDINAVILTHLHFDHSGGCTQAGPGRQRGANLLEGQVLRTGALLERGIAIQTSEPTTHTEPIISAHRRTGTTGTP